MPIERRMDKEDVVHIYSGILLSHKKGQNNATCSDTDGPRDCHTKWSKSHTDKYDIAYMWNLKAGYKWKVKVTQPCPTLCDPMDLNSPRNSPGQNTGVGSLSFLQRIFPTQGSNPWLLHSRRILYQRSYQGSPELSERAKSSLFNI